jgi:hypothetical protein
VGTVVEIMGGVACAGSRNFARGEDARRHEMTPYLVIRINGVRIACRGDSQLLVFEALPHAFWYHFQLPETEQALEMMAKFFDEKLGH